MQRLHCFLILFGIIFSGCTTTVIITPGKEAPSLKGDNNKITKSILSGNLKEMKSELDTDAKTDSSSPRNISFLHIAARSGRLSIVKDLADDTSALNATDSKGNTPLHYATINGWTEIASYLIQKGADVNKRNNKGRTPLHLVILSIATESNVIPSSMPIKGPITSRYGIRTNPFKKNYEFHGGIDFGGKLGTPIRSTAQGTVIRHGWHGGLGHVIYLKHENGFKTIYGHCKSVKVRKGTKVKKGQVIAYVGETGLATGAHVHYEVRLNGMSINPFPFLHLNNYKRDISPIITLLKTEGANFNIRDRYGKTALHYAALRSTSATRLLVRKGSWINARDYIGMTPLHYAAMTDLSTTKVLLASRARVNIKTRKKYTAVDGTYYRAGATPLAIALQKERLDMAKLLLRYGGRE